MNEKEALKIAKKYNKHKLSNFQKREDGIWIAYCKEKRCDCVLIFDLHTKLFSGSALHWRCGKQPEKTGTCCCLTGNYKENYKSPFREKIK